LAAGAERQFLCNSGALVSRHGRHRTGCQARSAACLAKLRRISSRVGDSPFFGRKQEGKSMAKIKVAQPIVELDGDEMGGSCGALSKTS
jgi:hypothetical protein